MTFGKVRVIGHRLFHHSLLGRGERIVSMFAVSIIVSRESSRFEQSDLLVYLFCICKFINIH